MSIVAVGQCIHTPIAEGEGADPEGGSQPDPWTRMGLGPHGAPVRPNYMRYFSICLVKYSYVFGPGLHKL